MIGGYMVIGSTNVTTVGGTLPLGVFLATINIFKEIGAEIQEIYLECMEVQKSFGPLVKISTYMNLPTDLKSRKVINRMRRNVGEEERQKQRQQGAAGADPSIPGQEHAFAVDRVALQIDKLAFKF